MSAKNGISKALSVVLPGGALGASLALALACAPATAEVNHTATAQPGSEGKIAERLQTIRAGVSEMSGSPGAAGSDMPELEGDSRLIPTWWGNGGWGRWHLGWGNGGWGNGGWHNWHNGWNNWGNGWHNFWHNG